MKQYETSTKDRIDIPLPETARRVSQRRVTFVASTLGLGGAERMLREFAVGLDRKKYEVSVVCFGDPGRIGMELASLGVQVFHGLMPSRWDLFGLLRLRSTLRKIRSDVVIFLDHRNAMTLGVLASLGITRKRIVAVHSTRLWSGKRILGGPVSLTLRLVDRVIAVGPNQARYLCEQEGVRPEKVAVVPNGVEISEFQNAPDAKQLRADLGLLPDSLLVGIVGALRPEKNHELFIDAAAAVLREIPEAEFVIVGGGGRMEQLKLHATRLGVEGRVHFLGERDDARTLVHVFDIAVLCSHPVVETLPVFLMEAMAWGKPVVATRVGDIDWLVQHGVTGLLVNPGSRAELTDALQQLLKNAERRREMGHRGKDRVTSQFSLQRSVLTLEDLIEGELRNK